MTFAKLLAQYTKGITLDRLCQECAARGVKINRVNISRIRSGHRLPPLDTHVIRTIAHACGQPPDQLLFLAQVEREGEAVVHAVLRALDPSGRYIPHNLDELVNRIKGQASLPEPLKERTLTVTVEVDGQTLTCVSRPVEWGGTL